MSVSRRVATRIGVVSALVLVPLIYSFSQSHADQPRLDVARDEGTLARYAPRDVARRVFGDWEDQWRTKPAFNEASDGDVWLNLDEDLPLTRYEGGLAGYTVWSNLHLSAGAFLAVPSDDPEPDDLLIPPVRHIMSADKEPGGGFPAAGDDRWRVENEDVVRGELGKRAIMLKGVTYIFNDGPGGEGYLVYFRHFVLEAFLGATRALAHALGKVPPTPKRVWFPRCGRSPSWRDDKGENPWFLAHLLPATAIEDATGWDDRQTSGLSLVLEQAVIVDRWSAHSVGGEVGKWGKMNAAIPDLAAPLDYWSPFRKNMMRSLGVDGYSRIGSRGLPVIVYIDRQRESHSKLSDEDHENLVEALKTLTPLAEVHVTKLGSMTKAQQVELLGRAEIILGCHSDEMMTALWLRQSPRSTLIEFFEADGFAREFQILARSLHHRHIAWHDDHEVTEKAWRKIGGKRGEGEKSPFPIKGRAVVEVIKEILDGEAGEPS